MVFGITIMQHPARKLVLTVRFRKLCIAVTLHLVQLSACFITIFWFRIEICVGLSSLHNPLVRTRV